MLAKQPDILCLQEVKVSDPEYLYNFFTASYEHYYNFSTNKGHHGVYIFSMQKPLRYLTTPGLKKFDSDGRFLCLEYEDFTIINVYMPHGGRDKSSLPYKLESHRCLKDFISEYCLAPQSLSPKVKKIEILDKIRGSDYCPMGEGKVAAGNSLYLLYLNYPLYLNMKIFIFPI